MPAPAHRAHLPLLVVLALAFAGTRCVPTKNSTEHAEAGGRRQAAGESGSKLGAGGQAGAGGGGADAQRGDVPVGMRPAPVAIKVKKKSDRSTSSSSGEKDKKGDDDDSSGEGSLGIRESGSGSSASSVANNKYVPVSTVERHGWRKWHRSCYRCEGWNTKWREPSIGWVCGGYQRARRTFKSACMMRFRNCQDGTMFVKIHNGRCANDTADSTKPHGSHFMYDYRVKLSHESSETTKSGESTDSEQSSESSGS